MTVALVKATLADFRAVAGLDGGAFYGAAPQENAAGAPLPMPYGVLNELNSSGPRYSTCSGDATEVYPLLFHVYGVNAARVKALIAAVRATFEAALPALDSGRILAAYVGSGICELDPDRPEDGKEVWHGTTLIEFDVQRDL